MLKINRKIEYAIVALKYMLDKDKKSLTTAKEICEAYDMPFDPTARVLQIMTQNGILKAEQGVKGGYRIVADISKVSIRALAEMIEGPMEVANCLEHSRGKCQKTKSHCCDILAPMMILGAKMNQLFDQIMLMDLIKPKSTSK